MEKFIKSLLAVFAAGFLIFGLGAARAQENLIAPAPTSPAEQPVLSGLFIGQTHTYRIIFRGNGEAIVYLNVDFTNTTDNTLNEFVFETPVSVNDMTILQYRKVNCDYNYVYDVDLKRCAYRYASDASSNPTDSMYYYGGQQNVYQKAKFTNQGNVYTVTLPTPVDVNGDSFLLLGFTTKAFVTQSMGGFDYSFTSVKVSSRITNLSISIDVDEDLLLKNATTGSINYTASGAEKSVAPDAAVTNQDLDNLVASLGYSGSIFKTYKELSSMETVTMTGEYAPTWARLYLKEILIAVVVVIIIFAGLTVLVKLLKKRKKSEPKQEVKNSSNWIIIDTALGFASALGILIFSLVLIYFSQAVGSYGYYSYGYAYGVFMILVWLIIILVYGFLALFAPIYRGKKRGWGSFGLVFFSEIVFLVIMAVIFVGVWVLPNYYPYPVVY